ncbi:MAG: hypothetical protein IKK75_12495 [Clostridia bacterium]|nr:hypothetical protein [Clostridia bacterium]
MSTVAYKCPNCASPLTYDGATGKMICAACDGQFDQEVIEALSAPAEGGVVDFTAPTEGYSVSEAAQMQAYNCKSCGAALITEGTTTATECPYCGSPAILPARIDGGVRPEKVVPFVITKEQAQEAFENYFKGKKLLPNIFKKDNHIMEMRRLFVPYWLFDCDATGHIVYDAEKKHVQREGEWEITTTEHYMVRRAGSMHFENIPVDGSEKLDNKITESLEPYDLTKAVPFQASVLAGAMADHADVDAEDCEERAVTRVKNSVANALRATVSGYTSVTERSRQVSSEGGKVTPVLLPVWLITTEKEGKTYTFAINGQTGQLTCDVPTDKGKAFLWGAGAFAGVMGAAAAVLAIMGKLASGTLLMAGVAALIVALCVVGGLIGQLKQAANQSSASGYSESGLDLRVRWDRLLNTTTSRRKIETKSAQQAEG